MDKKLLAKLLSLFKKNFSPEDVSDAMEGYRDALEKGMSQTESALYAVLETKSEEVAADGQEFMVRLVQFVDKEYDLDNLEHRQQIIRAVYRDTAKLLG